MTTIIPAAGSTFDMGAGLTLTIHPRCKSANRRNREESQVGTRRTATGAENHVIARIAFSHCKRHGAEPIITDDLAPIR